VIILIYVIVLGVYFICPKYLKLVLLIVNLIAPDTIPVIDEIIMAVGLLLPGANE